MIRQNLHTHTVFDDGKNTPMEMAQAALDAELTSLGFSGHSVLPFPNDWSLTEENLAAYIAAVRKTKAAFAGRLAVYSGLEWDVLSEQGADGFDYIIGSVHHIPVEGAHPSVDESPAATRDAIARYFRGSAARYAEAYFAQYEALAANPAVDIVGHFDVLTKFDERDDLLDGNDPAYRAAAMEALELLCRADKIFEVNTGAMSRGWRTAPYPSAALLRELKARSARVLVTSDAHSAAHVAHAFDGAEALLRSLGFRETWEYDGRGFSPVPL